MMYLCVGASLQLCDISHNMYSNVCHFSTIELAQQGHHRSIVPFVRFESPIDCANLCSVGQFTVPSNIVCVRLRQSHVLESDKGLDMHTHAAVGETIR